MIQWTQQFETGIDEIDVQHKELVAIINQLSQVVLAGARPAGVLSVVNRLASYTAYHFEFEEALMARTGYPDLEAHKLVHQNLARQVHTFREKLVLKKVGISSALTVFLKSWLMRHIMDSDMAYARHIEAAANDPSLSLPAATPPPEPVPDSPPPPPQ